MSTQYTIPQMMQQVTDWAKSKGWYETERTFGDEVALLHSEVSEMLEAYRTYGTEDVTDPGSKPEGIGSEAADILIRLLDTCARYEIDLVYEYERKMKYNQTRAHRHGGRAL